jgi:hypothetical protein
MSNTAKSVNLLNKDAPFAVRYFDETNGLDKAIKLMLNERLDECNHHASQLIAKTMKECEDAFAKL